MHVFIDLYFSCFYFMCIKSNIVNIVNLFSFLLLFLLMLFYLSIENFPSIFDTFFFQRGCDFFFSFISSISIIFHFLYFPQCSLTTWPASMAIKQCATRVRCNVRTVLRFQGRLVNLLRYYYYVKALHYYSCINSINGTVALRAVTVSSI